MGSFTHKLVTYFLLLALVPIAAAFWGFASLAYRSETRRTDARLEAGLRATLGMFGDELQDALTSADQLARDRELQQALRSGDRAAAERIARHKTALPVRVGSGANTS